MVKDIKIAWLHDFYGWEKTTLKIDDYNIINGSNILSMYFEMEEANKNLFVAKNIDIFGNDILLYQCDSPSKIKDIPIRFFYYKDKKAYLLKGSNKPIYDLFEDIREMYMTSMEDDNKNEDFLKKVMILFFDNVSGKHGRFELIDCTNIHPGIPDLIKNRILLYNKRNNKNVLFPEEGIIINELLINYIKGNLNSKLIPVLNKWENCLIIFQDTLFKADIIFSPNDYSVSLSNENIIELTIDNTKREISELNIDNNNNLVIPLTQTSDVD